MASIINNGISNSILKVILVIENHPSKTSIQKLNNKIIENNKVKRIGFNGLLILYNNIKPVKTVKITARVEICSCVKLNIGPNMVISIIFPTIVIEEGKDFPSMFIKKFPLILSLFGSKASIKEGIPIVTMLVRDN